MVTTMPLHELMNLHDQAEQDKALRRAFAPYTPDIELEGEEYRALVVMSRKPSAWSTMTSISSIASIR